MSKSHGSLLHNVRLPFYAYVSQWLHNTNVLLVVASCALLACCVAPAIGVSALTFENTTAHLGAILWQHTKRQLLVNLARLPSNYSLLTGGEQHTNMAHSYSVGVGANEPSLQVSRGMCERCEKYR
jgi:hypothetical protein